MGIQLNSSPDQHLQSRKKTIKMSPITSILILVLATCALTSALPQREFKQSAAVPNFGCQCNSYTILKDGKVQGNCRSTSNGAQWCYVDRGNTCVDSRPSFRGYNPSNVPSGALWSYEACATPAFG